MSHNQNFYNIPYTSSFLDNISLQLLQDNQDCLENLANYLILVPNNRVLQKLQQSFLKSSKSQALILPRILALNDLNHIINNSSFIDNDFIQTNAYNDIFKSSISTQQRAFILAKLIQKKDKTLSINQAIIVAESLGKIIDNSYFEDINLKNLDKIIDINLASHWQEILNFLTIATEFYPQILLEKNAVDIIYKQNLIYQLQNIIWQKNPPKQPIIALNITSYYRPVINLMNTISKLPQGKVIFHGIDFELKDKINYQHPQKIIEFMLKKMQVAKQSIQPFNEQSFPNSKDQIIHRLFDTNTYKNFHPQDVKTLCKNITTIVSKNEQEEALNIALMIRELIEIPEKTIGIIANNKFLITQIKTQLQRWNIEVNNYLGEELSQSIQAKFFILVGKILFEGFEPNLFLALLNNPLSHFKYNRSELVKITKLLDLKVLRQPLTKFTLDDIIELCKKSTVNHNPTIDANIKHDILEFLNLFKIYFKNHTHLMKNTTQNYNFKELIIFHITVAEKIAKQHDVNENNKDSEDNNLWSEQAGKQLSILLSELIADSEDLNKISPQEYLGLIERTVGRVSIREVYNKHPRIFIYGNLQNYLINHDCIIIAGLNDNQMPSPEQNNPWLNQYISKSLGFLPKEKNLGEQSLLFCQNLGSQTVILSRSQEEQGTLAAPSRWLLRLETFLEYYGVQNLNKKEYIKTIANNIDTPSQNTSYLDFTNSNIIPQEAKFNPPKEYRPSKIPVTKYELLIQNPYLFFIERILKLKPLDDINQNMDNAIYGNKIHAILETFFINFKDNQNLKLTEQIDILENLFEKIFSDVDNNIKFHIFIKPMALSMLHNFAKYNFASFKNLKNVLVEKTGYMKVQLQSITISITGKADRIDVLADSLKIIDYKTSVKKIKPYQRQHLILPIILQQNGFNNITFNNSKNIDSSYLFLEKKYNPKIVESNILDATIKKNKKSKKDTTEQTTQQIAEIINNSEIELHEILHNYYEEIASYAWNKNDTLAPTYHKHFARFDEWSDIINDEDEDEENEENSTS